MDKKIFEPLVGKQVEIFLVPDTPRTSGTLLRCEDDYIVLGEEFWAYPAIMGIRPLKKSKTKQPAQSPKPEVKEAKESKEFKNSEAKSEPKPEEPAPAVEEPKSIQEAAAPVEVETTPKPSPSFSSLLSLPEEAKNCEFEGNIASFFPEKGWGFIESPEVKNLGIELNDGERVFVHMNQIIDEGLRFKLSNLTDKNARPNIEVIFKLSTNNHGAVADDVREKGNTAPKLPDEVLKVDMSSAIYEEGEIEYFRRYEEVPHGEIRVKGNKLYRFDEEDVVDPVLAVFLECSPSAEGQKVKFIKKMGKRGKMKAANVSAAVPFPDEKIKDWERSGLIQKAKERMGIEH